MNVVELGTGVFCLTPTERGYGHTNIGLICDPDGLTVVDAGPTPEFGSHARAVIADIGGDLPLKRVVLTSSRVVSVGGSTALWPAAFFGSEPTSAALDQPLNPAPLTQLLPQFAADYLNDEFTTVPISHEVGGPAWLTPSTAVNAVAGDDDLNALAEVPGAGVIFAGGVASFGVTPLGFAAAPLAWADSLDRLAESGATIVPGHGPVGDGHDAATLAAYLRACDAAAGNPDRLTRGPWDSWTDRRFDAVNVERAVRMRRGDHTVPRSFIDLLGL